MILIYGSNRRIKKNYTVIESQIPRSALLLKRQQCIHWGCAKLSQGKVSMVVRRTGTGGLTVDHVAPLRIFRGEDSPEAARRKPAVGVGWAVKYIPASQVGP